GRPRPPPAAPKPRQGRPRSSEVECALPTPARKQKRRPRGHPPGRRVRSGRRSYCTSTDPVIAGCIVQRKLKVPAVVKVFWNTAPAAWSPDPVPSVKVTLWVAAL